MTFLSDNISDLGLDTSASLECGLRAVRVRDVRYRQYWWLQGNQERQGVQEKLPKHANTSDDRRSNHLCGGDYRVSMHAHAVCL